MRTYETGTLTGKQADEFISLFDAKIGTETETSEDGQGGFVVSCFELEANEVSTCRNIEKKVTKA